jgi:hypothetical protein
MDLFPALFRLTGDKKYAEAWRLWKRPTFPQRGVGDMFAVVEIADRKETKDGIVAWSREAKLDCPGIDDLGHMARQRMFEWELTGDERPVYEALEACVRKMRLTFEAHTWGEPIDDRIWLPDHPLIVMAEGDMSHERNQMFPRHYVSYEGFADSAAWVREKSDEHLLIWLYSFSPRAEDGKVRVWRTPYGRYKVTMGGDADGDGQPDAGGVERSAELHQFAAIPVTLPPRKLFAIRIDLVERSKPRTESVRGKEDFFDRPDLAVSGEDVRLDDKAGDVTVTVHNVGNRAAKDFTVALLDGQGRRLAVQTVKELDAPLDLVPRRIAVRFAGASAARSVVVDPENRVAEIVEENNQIVFPSP